MSSFVSHWIGTQGNVDVPAANEYPSSHTQSSSAFEAVVAVCELSGQVEQAVAPENTFKMSSL
jgi:hypothetical protein